MPVAFIKRLASAVTKGWDDKIKNASLCHILAETLTRVREADPVEGNWCMDSKKIAGVALETNGMIIEDACWLRPTYNAQHINLAELDTALKGTNLALQWEATVLHLVTDSACMHW